MQEDVFKFKSYIKICGTWANEIIALMNSNGFGLVMAKVMDKVSLSDRYRLKFRSNELSLVLR